MWMCTKTPVERLLVCTTQVVELDVSCSSYYLRKFVKMGGLPSCHSLLTSHVSPRREREEAEKAGQGIGGSPGQWGNPTFMYVCKPAMDHQGGRERR